MGVGYVPNIFFVMNYYQRLTMSMGSSITLCSLGCKNYFKKEMNHLLFFKTKPYNL